jgi:DNA ligase 1
MKFSQLANYWQAIESLDSRLAMTEKLSQLFLNASFEEIDKICYLSLGMLAPKFKSLEMQLAEKMMIRSMASTLKISVKQVTNSFKQSGDLGLSYQNLAQNSNSLIKQSLSVSQVFDKMLAIAKDNGIGSQERKLLAMADLLKSLDDLSGKFVVRIVLKKLRLGFSDMTIIDALSWMETGDKSLRPEIEHAFNVRADIGQIAQIFKKEKIVGISKIIPQPGTPIRPAKATPLTQATEIMKKMSGKTALEPKFDGFRVQIHLDKNRDFKLETEGDLSLFSQDKQAYVQIFSRNLDNTTHMFPDLVKAAQNLPVNSIILDGEAIAIDPKTGKMLDFQETVKRKRKHDIGEVSKKIPLKAFIFDILFLNGESLVKTPFVKRRQLLEEVFKNIDKKSALALTQQKITDQIEEFNQFFQKMANEKLEGLMSKKLNSPYKAGARDFTWVKYKLGMQSEMADTVDAVVMGYFKGQGKWTKFGLGKVLVGIPKNGQIISLSKVGSGFSEEAIVEMVKKCKQVKVLKKPKNYQVDKNLIPDVWVEPKIIIEIRADSVSRSSLYATELSLRFPRFMKFRDDKNLSEATNLEELKQIAKNSQSV